MLATRTVTLSDEPSVTVGLVEDGGNLIFLVHGPEGSDVELKGLLFDFDDSIIQEDIVLFRTEWDPITNVRQGIDADTLSDGTQLGQGYDFAVDMGMTDNPDVDTDHCYFTLWSESQQAIGAETIDLENATVAITVDGVDYVLGAGALLDDVEDDVDTDEDLPDFEFEVVNQWTNSETVDQFQGSFVVSNDTDETTDDFEILIENPEFTIDNLWGGEYETLENGDILISGVDWNKAIAPGGESTVGFNATGTPPEDGDITYSVVIDGETHTVGEDSAEEDTDTGETGEDAGEGEPEPSIDLPEFDYSVNSEWVNGGTDAHFQASIVITNDTEMTTEGFSILIENPEFTIDGSWGGQAETLENGDILITGFDWNEEIAPGQSVTVGFNASGPTSDGSEMTYSVQFDGETYTLGDEEDEDDNLVTNGTFASEDGEVEGWNSDTGEVAVQDSGDNGVDASDGDTFVQLDTSDEADNLHQDVDTEEGETYTLKFDAVQHSDQGDTINVYWNDARVGQVTPGDEGWNSYEFEVTGTDEDDRIEFREEGDGTGEDGPYLDNVSLTANPYEDMMVDAEGDEDDAYDDPDAEDEEDDLESV